MGCTPSRLQNQGQDKVFCIVEPLHCALKVSHPHKAPLAAVAHATNIEDLPPLLLARILSDHCSWQDIFGSIPLVCRAWQDVVRAVTPERLAFEFDLCDTQLPHSAADARQLQPSQQQDTAFKPPCSTNAGRPGTLRKQSLPRQMRGSQQVVRLCHGNRQADAALHLWLLQHASQLHDLSLSVTAAPPGSVSAAAQCELKERLLLMLAGAGSCCSSSSSSSSSSYSGDGFDGPELQDSCSVSAITYSGGSAAACRVQQQLQLSSLVLQLPLFENDINMLADGICLRAPLLQSLTMVGFAASSSRQLMAQGGFSSRHYTAVNCSQRSSQATNSLDAAISRSAHRSCGTTGSNNNQVQATAGVRGSQTDSSAPLSSSSGASSQQSVLKSHGFITGSSLQHLMASAQQLRSLTFASRQLYKLGWLAPATQLQHLACCDCQLSDACLQELVQLKLPFLTALDLSNNASLGAPGSKSLQLVAQLTRLTELNISGWTIGAAGKRLQPLAGLRQLAALQLDGCGLVGFSDAPFKDLAALTSLSLADNPLSSLGIEEVCSLSQLRELDLSGVAKHSSSPLQMQMACSAACWAGFAAMPRLVQLRMTDNHWPECYPQPVIIALLKQFCPAIGACSSLRVLDVSNCKFPHKLLQALVRGLPASLSTLVLDGCIGVKRCDLEPLSQLPGLRSVSAAALNPPVRDKHCFVLAKCSRLRELCVAGNDISPKGLAVLSCMPMMLELDVSCNAKLLQLGSSTAAAMAPGVAVAAAAGW